MNHDILNKGTKLHEPYGFMQQKPGLDCVHTMPAHFENGEKFNG